MKAIFSKKNLIAIGILMLIGLVIFIFSTESPTVKQKVYSKFSEDKDRAIFDRLKSQEFSRLTTKSIELFSIKCGLDLTRALGANDAARYQECQIEQEKLETENDKLCKADYILQTSYKDTIITDFGDVHYIDSIKCIRYNQMLARMPFIDKVEKEAENQALQAVQALEVKRGELERLNKPCK